MIINLLQGNMKTSFSRGQQDFQSRKHCQTCNCGNQAEFFQWRKERKIDGARIHPIGAEVQSKMREFRGPISRPGDSRITGEKLCWYRSVSPKRPNIRIKVSTPMNPNLFPAETCNPELSRVQSHIRYKSEMPRAQMTPVKLSESISTQVTPLNKNQFSAERNSRSFIYTQESEKSERDRLRWSHHHGFIRNAASPNGFYNS